MGSGGGPAQAARRYAADWATFLAAARPGPRRMDLGRGLLVVLTGDLRLGDGTPPRPAALPNLDLSRHACPNGPYAFTRHPAYLSKNAVLVDARSHAPGWATSAFAVVDADTQRRDPRPWSARSTSGAPRPRKRVLAEDASTRIPRVDGPSLRGLVTAR
jgi:hypothetical protein